MKIYLEMSYDDNNNKQTNNTMIFMDIMEVTVGLIGSFVGLMVVTIGDRIT